ncbi:MAG: DUF5658 family protein [Candidatus Eisenbacteria bacterium]
MADDQYPYVDRRKRPTPRFSRYTFFGRRRRNELPGARRDGYFVDWVDGHYRTAVIALCIFIVVDALSTLHILSHGGTEVNPVMAWIIERSWIGFLVLKLLSALSALVLLSVHRHVRAMRLIGAVLYVAYGSIVLYHLILVTRIAWGHAGG